MRGKKIIILLGALASGVAPAQLVASPRRSTPPPARPSSSFSTNHRRRRGDAATPLLVATVNGALHALDERTGQPRWTLVTGGALLASYQANGTVKAMLPTASGDLLELSGGGVTETGLSARKMVDMMPFSVAPPAGLADGGPVTLLGSKTSRVLVLDAATGEVINAACSKDGDFGVESTSWIVRSDSGGDAHAEATKSCSDATNAAARRSSDTIFVSRSDYTIRAVQLGSVGASGFSGGGGGGAGGAPRVLWNLTFSDLAVQLRGGGGSTNGSGSGETSAGGGGAALQRKTDAAVEDDDRLFSADVRGRLFCSECEWRAIALDSPVTRVFAATTTDALGGGAPRGAGADRLVDFRAMPLHVVRTGASSGMDAGGEAGTAGDASAQGDELRSTALALWRNKEERKGWSRAAFVLDLAELELPDQSKVPKRPGGYAVRPPAQRSLVAVVGHTLDRHLAPLGGGNTGTLLPPPTTISFIDAAAASAGGDRGQGGVDGEEMGEGGRGLVVQTIALGPVAAISAGELELGWQQSPAQWPPADHRLAPPPPRSGDGDAAALKLSWREVAVSIIVALLLVPLAIFFLLRWSAARAKEAAEAVAIAAAEAVVAAAAERAKKQRDDAPEGYEPIGRLLVSTDLDARPILGRGSHGTVVKRGLLDGRAVAVKQMLIHYYHFASREMALLTRSDGHPNVLRYFCKEQDGDFVYLALELCQCSLAALIQRRTVLRRGKVRQQQQQTQHQLLAADPGADCFVSEGDRRFLLGMANGVAYLHSQKIVHRDLKPENVLIIPLLDEQDAAKTVVSERLDGGDRTSIPPPSSSTARELDAPRGGGAAAIDAAREVLSTRAADAHTSGADALGGLCAKISDMGLGKVLHQGSSFGTASSFHMPMLRLDGEPISISDSANYGSTGWQAPELLLSVAHHTRDAMTVAAKEEGGGGMGSGAGQVRAPPAGRLSRSVDVFSLGCLMHFVVDDGGHPFGEWHERHQRVMAGQRNIACIKRRSVELHDLVRRCTEASPAARPSALQVTQHPFFWAAAKRLRFLVCVSDRLLLKAELSTVEEEEQRVAAVTLLQRLGFPAVRTANTASGWSANIDDSLFETGGVSKKRRVVRYDFTSVPDALRFLRNKHAHAMELVPRAKQLLGTSAASFLRYFTAPTRFHGIVMLCYRVVQLCFNADDGAFQSFGVLPVPTDGALSVDDLVALHGAAAPEVEAEEGGGLTLAEVEATQVAAAGGAKAAAKKKKKRGRRSVRGAEKEIGAGGAGGRGGRPPKLTGSALKSHKTKLCRDWRKSGSCALGDACGYAHGEAELRPDVHNKK